MACRCVEIRVVEFANKYKTTMLAESLRLTAHSFNS